MIYKTLKLVLLSFALFASLWAEAQDFGSEPTLSTDEVIYWYRICSAVPGLENYAMTDLGGEVDGEDALRLAVYMLPTETEDYRSQWKLTAGDPSTDSGLGGNVILTNRTTSFQITNHSYSAGNHNCITLSNDAPGFTLTSLGNDAFKLESVEDDGVNRCLAIAEKNGEALSYPESDESTSCIGWKFFPVEIQTSIGSMKTDRATIRVAGKHISVSGCAEWQLFNALGEEMPHTAPLPTGIYMVKMPQKTVKIAIP